MNLKRQSEEAVTVPHLPNARKIQTVTVTIVLVDILTQRKNQHPHLAPP